MLELRNVTAGYGAFTALWDVTLSVRAGEAVAVVGPNGAGKTTLLRVISGLVPSRSGELELEGARLTGRAAHEIVAQGIAHVPEGRRIFPGLTVADNLKMGAFLPAARRRFAESLARVYDLFPVLAERSTQRAGSLSGGEQQMLAIGRALLTNGRLLLLDEPSEGLAPIVVREIGRVVRGLKGQGLSILIVEQNYHLALAVADRVYVMSKGQIVYEGQPAGLAADENTKRRYLGVA
jgi:branched-chain amino acid transport system ATP-binding protein